ncbi:MAG: 2-C-methyl-D-erythritol 4-phosphate cytidylyltransferase, partial [Candidatus Subteraquimicrobiales bacterium]|nr:2-C-methyl-D-erythritol 4-phosphate cytidylyltransferase [Candidatus Subteraquimicrobiales bacterium]
CSFLNGWDGVILGVLVQDTVKLVEEEMIAETLPRQKFLLAQTPQIFLKDPLLKAYEFARDSGFYGTDDASLLERLGYRIRVVMGSYENIKVTTSVDLIVAEEILKKRKEKN